MTHIIDDCGVPSRRDPATTNNPSRDTGHPGPRGTPVVRCSSRAACSTIRAGRTLPRPPTGRRVLRRPWTVLRPRKISRSSNTGHRPFVSLLRRWSSRSAGQKGEGDEHRNPCGASTAFYASSPRPNRVLGDILSSLSRPELVGRGRAVHRPERPVQTRPVGTSPTATSPVRRSDGQAGIESPKTFDPTNTAVATLLARCPPRPVQKLHHHHHPTMMMTRKPRTSFLTACTGN